MKKSQTELEGLKEEAAALKVSLKQTETKEDLADSKDAAAKTKVASLERQVSAAKAKSVEVVTDLQVM